MPRASATCSTLDWVPKPPLWDTYTHFSLYLEPYFCRNLNARLPRSCRSPLKGFSQASLIIMY